ncbi:glutamyl-tRNA reductase [Helicobacter pametensis]|uniref:glutamyl-tRNA reductase n=1 Tax=Helicobacter pametensis TaxID=95149 RepID=UPI0004863780|nr:glutamyl-tRNA reductase [Helicobacter pametensis]
MYCVISFSHKNLDISTREKIALPQDKIQDFYHSLFATFPNIQECILLGTCNRFELLMFAPSYNAHAIIDFIASDREIPAPQLRAGAQVFFEKEAIEHIFSVTSSLDSLVIGETQITGQLKSAYKLAFDLGFCKKQLTRVMHFAFKCAALVRSQTQISKNPVSISSVAIVHFLSLSPIKDKVAVVGTGEIGILCVKYLLSHGFDVLLLSRTLQNAQAIQDELQNEHLSIASFGQLPEVINSVRYLFCATGAPHTIITHDMIHPCEFGRIWFDLALPRDIDHIEREDISLFVIDDLQEVALENKSKREEELQKAHHIISEQVVLFEQWLKSLDVEPLIKAFRDKAKQCCLDEIERSLKKGFITKDEEDRVVRILHNAFNKFLHHPTSYIKTIKESPESDFIIENVKKLFDLEGEEFFQNPYKCERHNKND